MEIYKRFAGVFLVSTAWVFKVQALEKCNYDAENVFFCLDNLTFEGFCCNQQPGGYFSRCCYYPFFPPDVPTSNNNNWYYALAFAALCMLVYAILRCRFKLRRRAETQPQPMVDAGATTETAQHIDEPPSYREVTGAEHSRQTEATKSVDATNSDGEPPPYDWIVGEDRYASPEEPALATTPQNQHAILAVPNQEEIF